MFVNTLLDKSKCRQATELAQFRDGVTGITEVVTNTHPPDQYQAKCPLLTPSLFAAASLSSGQARRSPVMPELIDPLLAPHPPSPWRHSGSFSLFLQHILERTFRSVSAVGFCVPWLPPPQI